MSYFDDAHNRLLRYFGQQQYDLYDGVAIDHNAVLTISHILLSVALNSPLDTRNKLWYLWKGKLPIERALAVIPSTLALEEEYIPWDALYVLFDTCCHIKYVKEAVTTKILHKKRPYLIPIYDRYLWEHFKKYIDRALWLQGVPHL